MMTSSVKECGVFPMEYPVETYNSVNLYPLAADLLYQCLSLPGINIVMTGSVYSYAKTLFQHIEETWCLSPSMKANFPDAYVCKEVDRWRFQLGNSRITSIILADNFAQKVRGMRCDLAVCQNFSLVEPGQQGFVHRLLDTHLNHPKINPRIIDVRS